MFITKMRFGFKWFSVWWVFLNMLFPYLIISNWIISEDRLFV